MVTHRKSRWRPVDLGRRPKPLISAVVAQLKPAYLWLQAIQAKAAANTFNNLIHVMSMMMRY